MVDLNTLTREQLLERRDLLQKREQLEQADTTSFMDTLTTQPLAAGSRAVIRKDRRLSVLGPAAGAIATTGIFGKELQSIADVAISSPGNVQSFQDEAETKSVNLAIERASKRQGIFSPQNDLGKWLAATEVVVASRVGKDLGFMNDYLSNPFDVATTILDVVPGLRSILGKKVARPLATPIINEYTKAVGVVKKGVIKTRKSLSAFRTRIGEGIKSVVENKKLLQYGDEVGRLPKTMDEALTAVNQTKEEVFKEYTRIKNSAGGASVDMSEVATEAFENIFKRENIVLKMDADQTARAVSEINEIRKLGKVSIQEADDILKKFNGDLKKVYDAGVSSIKDLSSVSTKANIADSLRGSLNKKIAAETGQNFKLLKQRYGALADMEEQLTKKVFKMAKDNRIGLDILKDEFSSVPVVYGAFTGNIPLLTAGVTQKSFNVFIRSLKSPNRGITNVFKAAEAARRTHLPRGTIIAGAIERE